MPMTLIEREARAYTQGDTQLADAYGEALEAQSEATAQELEDAEKHAYEEGWDDGYATAKDEVADA